MQAPEAHIPRKYSIYEIDRLRQIVQELMTDRSYLYKRSYRGGVMASPSSEAVEMRLRTYMMGGVSVDEAEAEVDERNENLRKLYDC